MPSMLKIASNNVLYQVLYIVYHKHFSTRDLKMSLLMESGSYKVNYWMHPPDQRWLKPQTTCIPGGYQRSHTVRIQNSLCIQSVLKQYQNLLWRKGFLSQTLSINYSALVHHRQNGKSTCSGNSDILYY